MKWRLPPADSVGRAGAMWALILVALTACLLVLEVGAMVGADAALKPSAQACNSLPGPVVEPRAEAGR